MRPVPEWKPIAYKRNDRRGPWRECDNAPMPLAAAHELIGQNGRRGDPQHFFAQQRAGNMTYLMWKPAVGRRT